MKRLILGALAIGLTAPGYAGAWTFSTLYQFRGGADGASPEGRLVRDRNGILYGTTISGGSGGAGTVFRLDPASGQETVLYAFTLGGASGTTPAAGLTLDAAGTLYGTTERGGTGPCSYGCGTVFKLAPGTGVLTTLHAFSSGVDGDTPAGRVTLDGHGSLYGTTLRGGDATCSNLGCGTLFKLKIATKVLTTLHSFGGSADDGAYPAGAVVLDGAGTLYGTASSAGSNGSGIVFRASGTGAGYTVLHSFNYNVDGSSPLCDLAFKGGVLYGTTNSGGPTAAANGTVFSIDPASGAVMTLHSLNGNPDGIFPEPGVTLGKGGQMYGTANQGGKVGSGTLFSLNTATQHYAVLHDFGDAAGAIPAGGLISDPSGVLYGVTSYQNGTVYKLAP